METGCEHPTGLGCYKCCRQCNYDTHLCPGCGEPLPHGVQACVDCLDEISSCAQGEVTIDIERFTKMVSDIAQFSECRRRKVGAVLIDVRNGEVLGTGHNDGRECAIGCPRGALSYQQLPTAAPHDSPTTVCTTRHAEVEALADAGSNRKSSPQALMIVNHKVCENCSSALARLGIPFLEVEPV